VYLLCALKLTAVIMPVDIIDILCVEQEKSIGCRNELRDKPTEDCETCQVLYRDDGVPLGCVLRLHGGEATYAYTTTGALRRLGSCATDDAARRAVESAVGTEDGALW
jgi:hypothetical protein